jgi:hypothetical protein
MATAGHETVTVVAGSRFNEAGWLAHRLPKRLARQSVNKLGIKGSTTVGT